MTNVVLDPKLHPEDVLRDFARPSREQQSDPHRRNLEDLTTR